MREQSKALSNKRRSTKNIFQIYSPVTKNKIKKLSAQSNNGKILYSLQDVCRLFGINLQKARMEIRNDNIYEISLKKGTSKGKKLFILEKDLKNEDTASFILNRLKELETKVSVLKIEQEENMEKIKLSDKLFRKKDQ
ncbi:MAG TPA: hypothetical protein GX708_20580 [Gallicola sp.]|nr:hypothetical protein [Gallicola sp.]